jgi:hypothetical protein
MEQVSERVASDDEWLEHAASSARPEKPYARK